MLIKPVSLPLRPRHIDHTLWLTGSGTAAFLTLRGRVSRFSLRDGNEGTVEVQLRTGLLISYSLATPPTTLPTDMDADTASIDADATSTISSTGSAGGVRFRTRKNESDVYNYIKELNTGHFQCMVCARASVNQIWRTRSTTNWRGHLLSHHSDVYNPQAESSLGVFGRRTRSCTEAERMSPEDAKVCDDKLVVWIVANAYPFAVVDQEEFVAFCKALHPGYNVPCQRTIRKKVLRQWKMEKEAARVEIRREIAGRRCSFTTDMWTSPSKRGYMVITMNFIDSNWEMRSVIIAFKRVQYPHTGNRLAEHFIKAVKDMDGGILSSIWTVTVDNATNNTAMVRMMNRKLPSEIVRLARSAFEENVPESVPSPSDTSAQQVVQLSCTAHVLQLAVKEGLAKCPLVDSAIGYFRDLAKKISESTKLTEALQQVCADMLHDFITPKLDVVTRWNSTWIMLDSLLRMKLPLNELLRRIKLKEPPYAGLTIGPGDSLIKEITEESWTAVKTLFTFLEPIKEATDMLSASTYPTFGILLLTNHVIKFHAAETIEKTQDEHTKKFADAVKRKLDDYAPKLDKREARIATVLDPRAKQHLDVLVENVASVKHEVMDEFNQHYRAAFQAQQQSNRGPPSAQKKKGKSLRLLLARSTHQVASAGSVGAAEQTLDAGSNNAFVGEASRNLDAASDDDDSFAKELDRWLAADGMSEMTESRDVCTWFRVTGDVYPRIKLMAQDFLAITATSVPSEIAFSAAGIALSNRRARLGDDAVEAICELKSFFKFNQRKELHPSGTHE